MKKKKYIYIRISPEKVTIKKRQCDPKNKNIFIIIAVQRIKRI